jgi:pimeloyl-ACP methyl ester carboxylesterase
MSAKRAALIAAGLVASWITLIKYSRAHVRGLGASPNPATDYVGALERLRQLQAADDGNVDPRCRTRGLLHNEPTRRVIVLVHGITSCPEQFAPLGQQFFERGYNVLLARLPHHGMVDRMTTEVGELRAEELRAYADAVIDVSTGLGEKVIVAGLSAGGIVAAWAAQFRADVTTAVLIAPSLGLGHLGRRLQLLLMNVLLLLPDVATQRFYRFEDAAPYGYLGFSSRAMGEVLRLGLAVVYSAATKRPAAQHVLLFTNGADTAVNNQLARQLVALWQSRGLRHVEQYEFDRELHLHHDLVDINNPIQRVDIVYPVLLDLIDRAVEGCAGAPPGREAAALRRSVSQAPLSLAD